jgi:hypothetical protein
VPVVGDDESGRLPRPEHEYLAGEPHTYAQAPGQPASGGSTGRRLGVGAVVLLGFFAAALVYAGHLGLIGESARRETVLPAGPGGPDDATAAAKRGGPADRPPGGGATAGLGEWSRVGDVRLRLDRVAVRKAPFRSIPRDAFVEGTEVELVVWFTVENLSATKKLDYLRWSEGFIGEKGVALADELGNDYRYREQGFGSYVEGGLRAGTATINPGEPGLTDAALFQRPVSAATELRLSAVSPVVGRGPARHEFRIPASAWR